MSNIPFCLALAGCLVWGPVSAEQQANLFNCLGEGGIAVHFTSSSILGVPTLSLGFGGEGTMKSYPPAEILVETADAQPRVTVVTGPAGDDPGRTAVLLLPAIAITDEAVKNGRLETGATLIETIRLRGSENRDRAPQTTRHELTCEARRVVF